MEKETKSKEVYDISKKGSENSNIDFLSIIPHKPILMQKVKSSSPSNDVIPIRELDNPSMPNDKEETKEKPSNAKLENIRKDLKKRLSFGLRNELTKIISSGSKKIETKVQQRIEDSELKEYTDMNGTFDQKYEVKETLGEVIRIY